MHPALLTNPTFQRYYSQWQQNPDSIVFVPIANFLLTYDQLDDALRICREGMKRHPDLISGKCMMARIHMKRGNWEESESLLSDILLQHPDHEEARTLLTKTRQEKNQEEAAPLSQPSASPHHLFPSWNTVTMARILKSQGHVTEAKAIYETILQHDPSNEAAKKDLAAFSG